MNPPTSHQPENERSDPRQQRTENDKAREQLPPSAGRAAHEAELYWLKKLENVRDGKEYAAPVWRELMKAMKPLTPATPNARKVAEELAEKIGNELNVWTANIQVNDRIVERSVALLLPVLSSLMERATGVEQQLAKAKVAVADRAWSVPTPTPAESGTPTPKTDELMCRLYASKLNMQEIIDAIEAQCRVQEIALAAAQATVENLQSENKRLTDQTSAGYVFNQMRLAWVVLGHKSHEFKPHKFVEAVSVLQATVEELRMELQAQTELTANYSHTIEADEKELLALRTAATSAAGALRNLRDETNNFHLRDQANTALSSLRTALGKETAP